MLVCLSAAAIAQKASPSKPLERFDGCVLEPDEWTDADSIGVRLPEGHLETFVFVFEVIEASQVSTQKKVAVPKNSHRFIPASRNISKR